MKTHESQTRIITLIAGYNCMSRKTNCKSSKAGLRFMSWAFLWEMPQTICCSEVKFQWNSNWIKGTTIITPLQILECVVETTFAKSLVNDEMLAEERVNI